jgi:hypothetical protein
VTNSGALALTGVLPVTLLGDVNDYNPPGLATASILYLSTGAPRTVTGIQAFPAGRVLALFNTSAFAITLTSGSAGSLAANRFQLPTPTVVIPSLGTLLLRYSVNGYWAAFGQPTIGAATAALLRGGLDNAVYLGPKSVFDAAAVVTLAYAASTALDFAAGFNFDLGALTGNLTLANPINTKLGQSGRVRLPQDGTGGRTIAYGSWWKAPGGAQALSVAPNAVDCLYYFVRDAATVEYTLSKAFA